MLFTDGTILTIQELREHDNFVLEVASTESIELSSKLAIAQREIGYELTSFLTTRRVANDLSRVVVTEQLRDLLAKHTLSLIYRDAYNQHLNDRYLGRWKEFSAASERCLLHLFRSGIGLTGVAVPQARQPKVHTVLTGGLAQGLYYVQVAWQHLAGTVGEKSSSVMVECPGGSLVIDAGSPPENASGWHVYLGIQDSSTKRQNETPLSPGTTWTQGAAMREDLEGPETSGPDTYVRNSGQALRG